MTRIIVFITIAVITVVMAGPGNRESKGQREDHKRGAVGKERSSHFIPPFFRNVSVEGKKELGDILKNDTLTIAQVDTQITAIAEKYGLATSYKEFKEKENVKKSEIAKNTTSVIESLSSFYSKLSAIHENKDQTRKAQHDAIEALRKENKAAVDTIEFIRKGIGGHHGGHHGGPGGKWKHGRKNEEKKKPRGGGQEEKKTEEAVAN
ncbi:hypothetical protein CAEBREN_09698 [Caenorhabditis brenneri]|uniref:SXP/RAL-2 family protein Ani s 5-like cation-binding domain-containing protein n=1 Tax=Caenorhabditis brenneri TaxID=135651 RepID=G0PB48_CAEBE|nr:hypothetical protein CAEBREN_09698 [Caenorhabditis brenneri]